MMKEVDFLCYIGKKTIQCKKPLQDFNLNGALWGYREAVGL